MCPSQVNIGRQRTFRRVDDKPGIGHVMSRAAPSLPNVSLLLPFHPPYTQTHECSFQERIEPDHNSHNIRAK